MQLWQYHCSRCATTAPLTTRAWRCSTCGAAWGLTHPTSTPVSVVSSPGEGTLWRYASVLPVPAANAISLGEGQTPLVAGELAGHPVWFKLDFLQPTGSFKDRGASVVVSHAKHLGVETLIVDSSGNAAAAFAAYCAAAGMTCHIFAPASTSSAKLAQTRAYGATITLVEGSREAAATAAQHAAEEPGTLYASHNWHPLFVEGTKTWLLETWEQLGRRMPAICFLPVGGGSLLAGAWRAAEDLGVVPPCLVAAQPAACAPLVQALVANAQEVTPVSPGPTLAEGARIGYPPRGQQLLTILRSSHGWAEAVTEVSLVAALRLLWRQGLFVEPTAALGAAAFCQVVARGIPLPDGPIVIVLTGSGLKAPDIVQTLLTEAQ